MRTWRLLIWDGKKYNEANCGHFRFGADGPKQAIKKAGLNVPTYTIKYSRQGYGYYTGRVYVYVPETIAASGHQPADFIIEAMN